MAASWQTVQLFAHRVPFAQTDPTFGLNIGFYVFELPFYRLLQSFANTCCCCRSSWSAFAIAVAVISGASMPTAARIHVGVLVMLFLMSIAIGFQLDRYSLVYSDQSGIFQGVSYTDANARFLAINVMTVLAAFAGTLFLLFCFTRWWVPLTLTIVLWMGAYVALDFAYPLITQRIAVDPNQQGPGDAVHPEQHRHDPAGVQPQRLDERRRTSPARRSASRRSRASSPRSRTCGCGTTGRSARRSATCSFSATTTASATWTRTGTSSPTRGLRAQSGSVRAPGDARRPRAGPDEGRQPQQRQLQLGQPAPRLHPRHRAGDAAGRTRSCAATPARARTRSW
jgi:hypothetical protein